MAVTYFPFDSLSAENRDRAANSQIFADYLKSFFSDGIFPVLDQFPNMHQLAVRASNPAGMSVVVDTGMGLISGRQYAQDAERTLQIPTADTSLPRKDRIVLRMDLNTQYRNNELYVVTGTAASSPQPPALTRNNVVYELALATISVAANATSITAADITDERANTDVCGYVTNVLGQVDTSVINAQFQAFFEQTQENTADWEDAQQAAFTAWFNTIKGQLGEDAAGNLQNQIGELANLTTSEKSNLVNAINEVNAKEPDVLDTMEEINANTDAGKSAGALAVKELSSELNKYGQIRIYSTDEKTIGQWVDGKNLYRKVFDFSFPSLTINTWNDFLTVPGATKIIKAWGVIDGIYPLPYIEPMQAVGFYFSENEIFIISSTNNWAGRNAEFVVEYLKD